MDLGKQTKDHNIQHSVQACIFIRNMELEGIFLTYLTNKFDFNTMMFHFWVRFLHSYINLQNKTKIQKHKFRLHKTKNRQKNANFSSNSFAVQVEELLLLSTIFSFNFRHFSWVLSIENNLHFGAWPKSEKALKYKKIDNSGTKKNYFAFSVICAFCKS